MTGRSLRAAALALLTLCALREAQAAPVGPKYFSILRVHSPHDVDSNITADLTNYPVLVSLTNAAWKTTASGGHVASASGYDITFYSDLARTSVLAWEIEAFDGSTGALIAWVKIPSLPANLETNIYMFYGDAGATSAQNTVSQVWTQFVGVWHGQTAAFLDSGANGLNASHHDCTPGVTGKIGLAHSCDGIGQYAGVTDDPVLHTATFAVSMWIKPAVAGGAQPTSGTIFWKLEFSGNPSNSSYVLFSNLAGSTHLDFQVGLASSTLTYNGTQTVAANTWYRVQGDYDGSRLQNWLNTACDNCGSGSGAISYDTNDLAFGYQFQGAIDEVRLSTVAATRSQSWVSADYLFTTNLGMVEALPEGRVGYTASNGATVRYNDQWDGSNGLSDTDRSTCGDTNFTTFDLSGNLLMTFNDGSGFNTGGSAPIGCGNNHVLGSIASGSSYLAGSNVNLFSGWAGSPGWSDGRVWHTAGIGMYSDSNRSGGVLYLAAMRHDPAPPFQSTKPYLMKSLNAGSTWCNPAHSSGIKSCSITAVADGDEPAPGDTPTINTSKCGWLQLHQFEVGGTGAITFEGNNSYIYGNCIDETQENTYVVRCARSADCTQSGTWEGYIGAQGGDVSNNANWSTTTTNWLSVPELAGVLQTRLVYVGPPFGYIVPIEKTLPYAGLMLRADSITGPFYSFGYLPGSNTQGSRMPNFPLFEIGTVTRGSTLGISLFWSGDYTSGAAGDTSTDPAINSYSSHRTVVNLTGPMVRRISR